MKQIFHDKAYEDLPKDGKMPVTFYYGEVIEDNGTTKLEWNDPIDGEMLLTAEELKEKDNSSRTKLGDKDHPIGGDAWKIQRNINYSAEYGSDKIRKHELNRSVSQNTPVKHSI